MSAGPGLVAAALAWLVLAAAAFFVPFLVPVWLLVGAAALPILGADAFFLLRIQGRLSVSRELGTALSLGRRTSVRLKIARDRRRPFPTGAQLFDRYPESFSCAAFPRRLRAAGWQSGRILALDYVVVPEERGEWEFPATEILYRSPLFLWKRLERLPVRSAGRTYPDFGALLHLADSELRGALELAGIKNLRKRGQGSEFESLREYRPGDSLRSVDWRATSRFRKPIVREYTEDRDQQVLFLLDTGYRLHRREGESLQFDQALNAVLLLSYVALKYGDFVAVSSFGAQERWLGPRKGLGALPVLMNGLYDLKSASVPSSPAAALEGALGRLKRRTFIILVSNLREEDGETLAPVLPTLRKKHLLLTVNLLEAEALRLARSGVAVPAGAETTGAGVASVAGGAEAGDRVLESAAAFSYLRGRRRLLENWERLGLLTLESTPNRLSAALINRYLDLKKSGRL